MLCDHLEGCDREGGREGDARGKRYGDICICITDSLCYKAETNTHTQNISDVLLKTFIQESKSQESISLLRLFLAGSQM